MSFTSRYPVRFSDTDPAAILYYPRLISMVHDCFEDWFEADFAVSYATVLSEWGVGFPTVKLECEYTHPLKFGDTAVITIWPSRVGHRSLTMQFEVHSQDSSLCAYGQVTSAVVDLKRFTAVPLPARLRAGMEAHLPQEEPHRATPARASGGAGTS